MVYSQFAIPRDGGELFYGVWGSGSRIVVCSHGITANHTTFQPVARLLGAGYTVVAPDHRGRGRSNGIRGPWGMDRHAGDLIVVMDHLKIQRADLLLGQSMGGFVSAVAAAQHGERFGAVLFADGGLPLMDSIPWFLPTQLFLRMMLGPSMKRLDMSFASRAAYFDYWRPHPALAGDWSPDLELYFDHDLIGEPPAMRSSTLKEAVIGDTESMMSTDLVPRSLQSLKMPVRLLRAPRGLQNGKPLYSERQVAKWAARIARFSSITIPDVNHYTIIMSSRGSEAVVREIKQLIEDNSTA